MREHHTTVIGMRTVATAWTRLVIVAARNLNRPVPARLPYTGASPARLAVNANGLVCARQVLGYAHMFCRTISRARFTCGERVAWNESVRD